MARMMATDKSQQVILAARKLFVDRGYYRVSIPDIVQASGVSTGAIYHHFGTKENLARVIHQQTLAEFQATFNERLLGKESARDKLRAFADLVFEITETDPERMEYMLFMKHDEFVNESLPICFTEPFRFIQRTVKWGIELGELRPGNFFLSAISFTGVILRPVELRLLCVLDLPLTQVGDEIFANAWAAIRADQ